MKETERKFLVHKAHFPDHVPHTHIRQGYLSVDPGRIVRIRMDDAKAFLTIKGTMTGITRPEFEYSIPPADAEELMKLALHHPVEKIRYRLKVEDTHWEVDEFLGVNRGLWLAEVELETEDQPFSRPEWLGEEVTRDGRYYNAWLAEHPWSAW